MRTDQSVRKKPLQSQWLHTFFTQIMRAYFTKGLVEVSEFGIGNKSICPGFGSAIREGKYPFFLQRKISILATSSPANSTALSCITAFKASFFVAGDTGGMLTLGLARTSLIYAAA